MTYITVIIKAVISVHLLDIQRNINLYYYRIETLPLEIIPLFFGFSNLNFSSFFQNTRENTYFFLKWLKFRKLIVRVPACSFFSSDWSFEIHSKGLPLLFLMAQILKIHSKGPPCIFFNFARNNHTEYFRHLVKRGKGYL